MSEEHQTAANAERASMPLPKDLIRRCSEALNRLSHYWKVGFSRLRKLKPARETLEKRLA